MWQLVIYGFFSALKSEVSGGKGQVMKTGDLFALPGRPFGQPPPLSLFTGMV